MKEKEQPIEPKMKEIMNDIGRTLGRAIKEVDGNYGFCLFVFEFGHGGRINYISNANREDMIATLKEFIAKAEGRHYEEDFTKKRPQ